MAPMSEPLPSLDGRRFAPTGDVVGGEVGADTVFRYHQADEVVWAEYDGGRVRHGTLVGTRNGDELDFRYTQLTTDGQTATGRCRSRITLLDDGRLRLDESWEWESRNGSGTSVVEELPTVQSIRVTAAEARAALSDQTDERFVSMLAERAVEVELYAPVGHDPQTPHDRDELYVVISGSGTFTCGEEDTPFGPHDVLYVPAGAEHRFTEFSNDFAVWVVFVGPARPR
jgi:mannose-6-phosphate isomerase-like protein (cupin superfamily)